MIPTPLLPPIQRLDAPDDLGVRQVAAVLPQAPGFVLEAVALASLPGSSLCFLAGGRTFCSTTG